MKILVRKNSHISNACMMRSFNKLVFCFVIMEFIFLSRTRDVRKNLKKLERELGIKIKIVGKRVEFDGKPVSEFEARSVFEAVDFGFSVRKALLLKLEDFIFKVVHIKSHTKRSLKSVRARLIGTKGKTRKAMSEISGCEILIKEGEVGIIGEGEHAEDVEKAVIHLIEGAKQGNMYMFLERMNRERKSEIEFE